MKKFKQILAELSSEKWSPPEQRPTPKESWVWHDGENIWGMGTSQHEAFDDIFSAPKYEPRYPPNYTDLQKANHHNQLMGRLQPFQINPKHHHMLYDHLTQHGGESKMADIDLEGNYRKI